MILTGSTGNITAFEGVQLKHESGSYSGPEGNQEDGDLFLESRTGLYVHGVDGTPLSYPGGIDNGNIDHSLTASNEQINTDSTVDPDVKPGVVPPADNAGAPDLAYKGFNFYSKRLLGGYEDKTIYSPITRLTLNTSVRVKVPVPNDIPNRS